MISRKIYITNKENFDECMLRLGITNDNVEEKSDTYFISINDTCGTNEVPYFQNKKNVKVMFFDDVEKDIEVMENNIPLTVKAFTNEQASELVAFIKEHEKTQKCIIHCAAGVSRSGAVGTFIATLYACDLAMFRKINPYIHPNEHVLKLLNDELNK